jgi:hypothetical protein
MNNTVVSLFTLAFFTAVTACDRAEPDEPAVAEVTHPDTSFRSTPELCDELTLARYDELVATIEEAIELAETDVANHGETGAYAIAPVYALDGLEDALEEAITYRDYRVANPILYAGVAYNLRFRQVQVSMWYAGHWANVSAVYHASQEARHVHGLTETIVQQADSLRADAGRCYQDWYFGTPSPF